MTAAPLPAVDVIVPCYNGARYLAETLDSALAQTHPDVRVLVVDDGSTDSTRRVVDGYGGRVDYVFKENGGQASARNFGIARTGREFVCLLDADDLVAPEMVERLVARLQSRPEADFAHSPPLAFFGRDRTHLGAEHWRPEVAWDSYLAPLSVLCAIHGSATVFRRRAFARFGPLSESRAIQGCEDWHFWLRAVTDGAAIEHVPDPLCFYRRHLGSSSASRSGLARRESELMRQAVGLFEQRGIRGEGDRAVLAVGIASVAARWLALGEMARYAELLETAMAAGPASAHLVEPLSALTEPAHAPLLHLRLARVLLDHGLTTLACVLFLRCRAYRPLRHLAAGHGLSASLEAVTEVVSRVVAEADAPARARRDPSYTAYLALALGVMERAAGRRAPARDRFEQALRLDPNNILAAVELARLELGSGRIAAAMRSAVPLAARRRALVPAEVAAWLGRALRKPAVSPAALPSPPRRPGDRPA